jgi:hypothetical protein
VDAVLDATVTPPRRTHSDAGLRISLLVTRPSVAWSEKTGLQNVPTSATKRSDVYWAFPNMWYTNLKNVAEHIY